MCVICNKKYMGVKSLIIQNCLHVKSIPNIEGLEELTIRDCPLITEIPCIKGLKGLEIINLSIRHLPNIPGLKCLCCFRLPLLKEIPNIIGLKTIVCYYCKLIKEIPISGIEIVKSIGCPLLINITDISNIKEFRCDGSKWLEHGNILYLHNINKLAILQIWFKKVILRRRILILLKHLIPLYYHPNAHGGYIHKRNMMEYLLNIYH